MVRIDISEDMTPEFFEDKNITKGKVLGFMKDGKRTELKIVRLNRKKRICEVEEVKLYSEDEMNAMERDEAVKIIEEGASA